MQGEIFYVFYLNRLDDRVEFSCVGSGSELDLTIYFQNFKTAGNETATNADHNNNMVTV